MILIRPKSKKSQQGVSLVEVMVAVVALVIGLGAIMQFKASQIRQEALIGQQNVASTIAQGVIEELRSYETIASKPGMFAYNDIVSGTRTQTERGAAYTINWVVDALTNPVRKNIDVNVSWQDRGKKTQTVTLSTVIIPHDPADAGRLQSTNEHKVLQ